VLVAFAAVIIIDEWGYDVNGLVAGLGIGGLAIALAAQDTLANLFGFTTIVGDSPFVEDEYIVTPDVEGVVESVGLRSTRIRQLDQAIVTIPNSKLSGSAITNWSRLYKRRINFVLGITYDATSHQMDELLKLLREMLTRREKVDPDSVVVYFINFGDSALEILVRCYVFESDWGRFTAEREAVNLAVMDIVESLGLSIAFPSQSIYVENIPALTGSSTPKGSTPAPPLRAAQKPAERIPQADEAEGGDGNYDEMDDAD
jgi:MscS family membrane protein